MASTANTHTWAASCLTERNAFKFSSLQNQKKTVLSKVLRHERKEPVHLSCTQHSVEISQIASTGAFLSVHSNLRSKGSSWQGAHALHSYLEMPITGRVQKQLQGSSEVLSKKWSHASAFCVEHAAVGTGAQFLESKENTRGGRGGGGAVSRSCICFWKINDGKRATILTLSAKI